MSVPIKFGTDGWRAVIADTCTFANVRRCATGLGRYLLAQQQADRGLVIGYDTRFGSADFAAAETLTALEIPVALCDRPAPTPAVSFTILDRQAAGAVIITASHNLGNYNGFKIRPDYAGSARPEIVRAIESHIPAVQAGGVVDYLFEKIGSHFYQRIDLTYHADQRAAVLARMEAARPDKLAGLRVTGRLTVDGFRFDLEDGGWLIVRFSGTEPLLRIYCETTHGERTADLLAAGRELAGI